MRTKYTVTKYTQERIKLFATYNIALNFDVHSVKGHLARGAVVASRFLPFRVQSIVQTFKAKSVRAPHDGPRVLVQVAANRTEKRLSHG